MARRLTYTKTSQAYTDAGEGAPTTHDIYAASEIWPAKTGPRDKGAVCDACGESFRVSQVRVFRGVTYGVPCGCSHDIGSILRQERAEREQPRRLGVEIESTIELEA